MIHAKASTAQDIARILRSAQEPITIVAPRGVGKTTELLKFAEEKNPFGQFVIVCHNFERQKQIIRRHWEIFNRIDQADIVAKRLLRQPLGGIDVNSPLMISPGMFHLLRGHSKPIYVDELCEISKRGYHEYVLDTGRFVAAVTS